MTIVSTFFLAMQRHILVLVCFLICILNVQDGIMACILTAYVQLCINFLYLHAVICYICMQLFVLKDFLCNFLLSFISVRE